MSLETSSKLADDSQNSYTMLQRPALEVRNISKKFRAVSRLLKMCLLLLIRARLSACLVITAPVNLP